MLQTTYMHLNISVFRKIVGELFDHRKYPKKYKILQLRYVCFLSYTHLSVKVFFFQCYFHDFMLNNSVQLVPKYSRVWTEYKGQSERQ